MKLYEAGKGVRIRVLGENNVAPGSKSVNVGDELYLVNLDGMYSYCKDKDGQIVHLVAWAEVEEIKDANTGSGN